MKKPFLVWTVLVAQSVLLGIEALTSYDAAGRQIALSMTNLVAVVLVLVFNRWLQRRGQGFSTLTILLIFGSVWLDAIGNFQHFYGRFWWWDHLTHGVGGMAITAGFLDLFLSWRRGRESAVSWRQAVWMGFVWGQFLGAAYEVSEYLGDFWFHTHRVGLHFDTSRDLTFNLAGGLLVIALFLLVRLVRSKEKSVVASG